MGILERSRNLNLVDIQSVQFKFVCVRGSGLSRDSCPVPLNGVSVRVMYCVVDLGPVNWRLPLPRTTFCRRRGETTGIRLVTGEGLGVSEGCSYCVIISSPLVAGWNY